MRKTLVSLGAAAALLLSSSAVRADLINFGYSASSAVNPVTNGNTIYNNNNTNQTSSVTFTPANGAATFDTSNGNNVASQFIIYNMTTQSTVQAGAGATYDSFNAVPFNLGVTVTDLASSQQQSFNFSGTYTAQHVSSSSSYVDPTSQGISWTTPTSATQTIGTNVYTMQIVHWTAPGAPGSAGSILAEISVTEGSGSTSPPPSGAPEPTSLVLAGLALPALLAARRRRNKVEA